MYTRDPGLAEYTVETTLLAEERSEAGPVTGATVHTVEACEANGETLRGPIVLEGIRLLSKHRRLDRL